MAKFSYHGGPLLSNIEIVTVYYGSTNGRPGVGDWSTDPMLNMLACQLDDFFYDITESAYLDLLAEYSSPDGKYHIGRGNWVGAFYIPSPVGQTSGNINIDIQTVLNLAIQQKQLPAPNANRSYFVFLPPGFNLPQDNSIPSTGESYHSFFRASNGAQVSYAVFGYPSFDSLTTNLNWITLFSSHELAEVITDPYGQGWTTSNGDGIAGFCSAVVGSITSGIFHSYNVSALWSETQGKCVVPAEDNIRKPPRVARIRLKPYAECVFVPVEGEIAMFQVDVSGVPQASLANMTYQWTVSVAEAVGPNDQPTFSARMPTASGLVTVVVTVTDASGCNMSDVKTYTPITLAWANFLTRVCEIRKFTHVNFFVNPLWDPLRDLAITPISERDVREVHQVAERLFQLTEGLVNQFEAATKRTSELP
jgi:hypothetical protein